MADAGSNYSDFVKWQIGLSTAALAGLWAKFDLLSAQSPCWRGCIVFFACLLLLSVWSGVEFLRWLYAIPTWKDRIKEIDEEIKQTLSPQRTQELIEKQNKLQQQLDSARKKQELQKWHRRTVACFAVVCGLAASGLVAASISPLQPLDTTKAATPPPAQPRYAITHSAVHRMAGGRREAHTFLLDQQTGELWQMVCGADGLVSFQHLRRRDFEGNIEPIPPTK